MANAHDGCEHETTKSARDRCRRDRRKQELADIRAATEARDAALAEQHKVTTIQVNPGIWATAMSLANGNRSRIRVISATQVEVT